MNASSMDYPWEMSQADMLHQWEYNAMDSSSSTITQYNKLFGPAADLFSILDNSSNGMPSSPGISNQSSPEGQEPTSTSDTAQGKRSVPHKVDRRREQNRSAQRAFRERKERHQRELEQRLVEMRQKHQVLVRSYSEQQKKVQHLKARFEALNTIKSALRSGSPNPRGTPSLSPALSDPVPFTDQSRVK